MDTEQSDIISIKDDTILCRHCNSWNSVRVCEMLRTYVYTKILFLILWSMKETKQSKGPIVAYQSENKLRTKYKIILSDDSKDCNCSHVVIQHKLQPYI